MLRLAGADALIIDLGQNRGGEAFMVRYLSGFFFAEPTHLVSSMRRDWQAPIECWSLTEGRPTDAFVDKPLFLLTSAGTFSAAESFAFGLQVNDRVTQVGERTGGGGHFGDFVEVGADLFMFLPMGRALDPRTGKGWEAEGVVPDIAVPYDQALKAALAAAKQHLAG